MDVYTDRGHKNDLLNWLGTRHLGGTNCKGLKNITDENVMDKIPQGSTNSMVLPAPYTCTQSYLVFNPHQQRAILLSLVLWRSMGVVPPIAAYEGRLHPKGVPFSGYRYMKR